jgi:hypothetical protein
VERKKAAGKLGLVLATAPLLTFLTLQFSCQGSREKLTKESALEKLSAALDCPIALVLPEGRITDHFKLDMPMPSLNAARQSAEVLNALEQESKIIRLLKTLADEGFISFSYSQPRIVYDPKLRQQPLRAVYDIQIEPTERGAEFRVAGLKEDSSFSFPLKYFLLSPIHEKELSEEFEGKFSLSYLKLCERVITGVTGIRKIDKSSSIVDYAWRFDRFTALGEFVSRDPEWAFHDGFFMIMALRDGTWSRVVDLLDASFVNKDTARFGRRQEGWEVQQENNP